MFNRNSPLVKTWVRLLSGNQPVYTLDDVPELGNLKEIVTEVVKARENK